MSEASEESDNGTDQSFLDGIIKRIMTAPLNKPRMILTAPTPEVTLTFDELSTVTRLACASLITQKSLLRIEVVSGSVIVVGDIHGQMRDLRAIISRSGDPALQKYLFLGDYVDRGVQGLETAILLLCLKTRHPTTVFLLRGNHEDCNTTATYGFYDECIQKFGKKGEMAWLQMINAFNYLPLCALVGERVLCMHGGLSPHMKSLADIEALPRPSIIPPYGLMCDLLWADPESTTARGWSLSSRGISFSFDSSTVTAVCRQLDVDVVVRAHQMTTEMFRCGYKQFAGGRLVTIFSAPNYLNMMNDAAVLRIDSNLVLRFLVFRPHRGSGAAKAIEEHQKALEAAMDGEEE